MIKTFKLNDNGKIEFTKEELSALLDEVWNNGYDSNTNYVWESPYRWTPWWERPHYYDPITTTPYVTWASSQTAKDSTDYKDYTTINSDTYTAGTTEATWTTTVGRTEDKVTPTVKANVFGNTTQFATGTTIG